MTANNNNLGLNPRSTTTEISGTDLESVADQSPNTNQPKTDEQVDISIQQNDKKNEECDEISNQNNDDKTKKSSSGQPTQDQQVWSLHSIPPRNSRTGPSPIVFQITPSRNSRRPTPVPAGNGSTPAYEMNAWHVLIFIVVASTLLILLFFFQFYSIIFVLYAIGSAGVVSQLVFSPLLMHIIPKLGGKWLEEFYKPLFCRYNGFGLTSHIISYTWSALWIWFGFTTSGKFRKSKYYFWK
jgi:hypothetical protein